ncbi:addiction module toxin RelE [Oribacterium sp. C9]|uniref:type II toxin-antitoxin system YafQ family toxin n=1 Tax=Oribacterium sp. C9 TaxID=1943579 RepID=UPI00098EEAA0|nr:type II toxin-antitoxin system YafQ family toxin [Oribacterium sp. C9]OON86198.1 addiction module toxin RelE [Oribacterium sp. C9]
MLTLKPTTKFKKDYKRMKKQGKDMFLLKSVIDDLLDEKVLDEKYQDHPLVGNYIGFRECHIQPDWLLIYAIDNDQLILTASRTGSHSDLFSL